MTRKFAIGTDIGGSHISCALIEIEKEQIVKGSHANKEVDNKAPADAILAAWAGALRHSMDGIDSRELAGIGFAMPGPFDYANGIALFTPEVVKYQNLYGIDVAQRLRDLLGLSKECSLRFMNDASAFAMGEAWMGKARGFDRSACITLGTGFGSAFIDMGIPVVERRDVPLNGCVWHLPFRDGIADDSFSTRWFIHQYALRSGKRLSGVREIANQAENDPLAKELFVEFGNNLGGFLGPWLEKFKAGVLVIGGNISGAYNLFGKYLEDSLKSQNLHIEISLSGLREDAAIIGSARLLDENLWNKIKPLLTKM